MEIREGDPEMIGRMIGQYRITRKVGEGGMGTVYAAHDERLDRSVALKMIQSSALKPEAARRLWREARTAAGINHPNICQVYEVGEANGNLFIAMELLDGESLAQRIARGPLPLPEAIQIGLEILRALAELEQRHLVHRDLKPSNVQLTSQGTKLLDFGLARLIDRLIDTSLTANGLENETPITEAGTLLGTPHYMAPEQIHAKTADTRTDLFAVGAILFEMLTGRRAFGGASVIDVFHAVVYEQPPVLGGSPAISAVDRIVHRALAKSPDDRYSTTTEMAAALRGVFFLEDTGGAVRARPMTRLIVLPFRPLRPDDETGFLAFSLPDAITSTLSGLQSLVVRSSAIASRFTDQPLDLKRIAAETEVDVVLTGTLLRVGEELRVSTQLVEAPAGTVIWSKATRSSVRNVFELQDDLVRCIVESLSLPLTVREERMLRHDVPVSAKAYEFYLRGNQLSYDWQHHHLARDFYLRSLEQDPAFAPAWARLGRCCFVIGKLNGDPAHVAEAAAAFKRALELNDDLAVAHNFYARMEADQGRPVEAMTRLLRRARSNRMDPELLASLVYACRYCGLLEESAAAHREARRLDPQVRTSVSRTYHLMADYQSALATSSADPDIEALALAALGRRADAIARLRQEEQKDPLFPHMRFWFTSLRAVLEGKHEESLEAINRISGRFGGPEGRYRFAEELAGLGETTRALAILGDSVDGGFFCYPGIVRDLWFDPIRRDPEFVVILNRAKERYLQALAAFNEAGGNELLGMHA